MKKLCIYHGNCADGFGAAWVVRKYYGEESVEFYPGVYQQDPPDVAGRDVIIVDFSYKRTVMEKLQQEASTLTLLDHHKSAFEDLSPMLTAGWLQNEAAEAYTEDQVDETNINTQLANQAKGLRRFYRFDMNHSGAMLAWLHFFPGQEPPGLIKTIEDRDLWRFKLPFTREIQAALFSYPYDFPTWDVLMREGEGGANLVTQGAAIERKHFKDIAEFIKVAGRRMMIAGHDVPVLNCAYFWSSDAGHIMAQGESFAACYWDQHDGRVFSLRSTDEGMDVSAIAKQYGGGGHRNAAGFKIPFSSARHMEAEIPPPIYPTSQPARRQGDTLSDKQHCRSCGAELVLCDECHGDGRVQVDGPRDPETGEIGYTENCGECGGRGGYAAH